MPTTRHLINRQRRLATAQATRPAPARSTARPAAAPGRARTTERARDAGTVRDQPKRAPRGRLPAGLAVLTVLLGGFAAWAGTEASALRDRPAVRNAALTDASRTSEVKGQVTKAVNALFSYDHAAPAAADKAVRTHLTGRAVAQHRAMLAPVRAQAARQGLVLTTTVTHSGVEVIDGDRARVLVYADQSNTRTATKKDETAHGAAMFAVEARRGGGTWRITAIDTLGAGS
ncbi:hypothetical protein ACLGI4_03680 [Streptomyces sp. HMX112]|uniref:hypothetical protein n=1 Tax=Streptomyces sp. HMX112 TaxID=3390850 RepID=UPI003A7FB17D